jgi:uncharacterized protein (DUF2267 family)
MQYDQFVKQVQSQTGVGSKEEALEVIEATLQTLGERLFGGEADDLAAQLPEELAVYIEDVEEKQNYNRQEFIARVAGLEGCDPSSAEAHIKGVAGVLSTAVTQGEWEDVLSQMPNDLKELLSGKRLRGKQAM